MPRYHVYTEARHPTGAVAAGHNLTVYDDAAGTIESDIYAAESGGSPLANPHVVPATGIVDFWATVPEPYVVAQGDATPRPASILVALPTDIGAASLSADNALGGTQTISGKKLRVVGGNETLSDFGQIEIDKGADWVGCLGILDNGLKVAQYAIDNEAAVIGVYTGEHTGVLGLADRIAAGRQAPHRVSFGGVVTSELNESGQPFISLAAVNTDLSETAMQVEFPHSQTGNVLRAKGDWSSDPSILNLNANGDVRIAGALVLKDGTDLYAITVVDGVLTTTIVARNYATNPSLELDTNSDGLADGVANDGSVGLTPTIVPGRTGGNAQRLVANPSGSSLVLNTAMSPYTGVGTFAPGEPVTASLYYKLSHAGCTVAPVITSHTAASGYIHAETGAALENNASFTRASVSVASLPAATSLMQFKLISTDIDTGDTLDITIDDIQIEKSATATDYFDGDSRGCQWSAAEHASESYRG